MSRSRTAPRLASLVTTVGLSVRGLTPATTVRVAEMALAMHEAMEAHGHCARDHLRVAGFSEAEIVEGSELATEALRASEPPVPAVLPFPLADIRRLRDARQASAFRQAA